MLEERIENLLIEMVSMAVLGDRGPMQELLATLDVVRDRQPIVVWQQGPDLVSRRPTADAAPEE